MNILSLDLGTKTGWAYRKDDNFETAGTFVLATPKELTEAKSHRWDRRLDIRCERLAAWLDSRLVDFVVFEDVRFASSQAQAHLWASFRGVLWSWATRHHVKIDCIDTSKLKVWTTGSGVAKKEQMRAAAETRWPSFVKPQHDDNAIDAICLLQWAMVTYGYTKQ